jgi:hypothetical protein
MILLGFGICISLISLKGVGIPNFRNSIYVDVVCIHTMSLSGMFSPMDILMISKCDITLLSIPIGYGLCIRKVGQQRINPPDGIMLLLNQ